LKVVPPQEYRSTALKVAQGSARYVAHPEVDFWRTSTLLESGGTTGIVFP
jgi:hypothetical protein